MRLIFAGTPEISATVLQRLINSNEHEIVAVYTQPDRPKGRGRQLAASPVKELALQHDLPVFQPEKLTDVSEHQADLMIVVAYGLILPQSVLDTPIRGCWNIHVSLLPRWRGAAPIQRAIEAGDEQTGVCIMQMDTGLDTGDVLLKESCDIESTDTAQILHDRLALLGADALMKALSNIDSLKPEPQSEDGLTYAQKLTKSEAWIDWCQSALAIDCKVRAFIPFPIAQSQMGDEIVRIHHAEPEMIEHNAEPGQILSADKTGLKVACAEGVLNILKLQMPGKKAMAISDVLNSKADLFSVGSVFSHSAV